MISQTESAHFQISSFSLPHPPYSTRVRARANILVHVHILLLVHVHLLLLVHVHLLLLVHVPLQHNLFYQGQGQEGSEIPGDKLCSTMVTLATAHGGNAQRHLSTQTEQSRESFSTASLQNTNSVGGEHDHTITHIIT